MNYSSHQLAFFAHQLTRRAASSSMEAMAGALLDAQVDLNPHQIDAAMFATRNPLSKGVILADEVGLGKTIEAGLLIAQRWAERKRRILVITPANLRKQWHQELADKFGLPATIFEAKSFRQLVKEEKIPKMVLTKCEWGHDDYSLNVENLPMQQLSAVAPVPSKRAASANAVQIAQGGLFDAKTTDTATATPSNAEVKP